MALKDALMAELKHEAVNTRKMLASIPGDKYGWQPHEKSMTLGRLAAHVAEIPVWVNRCVEAAAFDFATVPAQRNTYPDRAALMAVFEERLANAVAALQSTTDEALNENYTVLRGNQVLYSMPRKVMVRNFTCNHLVHHRGQLSVYLRLLDVQVPGMYGPSADGI